MADNESKTEKATPKRRRDERRKGHVVFSKDVVAVATLFGSMFMMRLMFGSIVTAIQELFYECFNYAGQIPFARSEPFFDEIPMLAVITVAKSAGPLLLVTVAVATVATFWQTRLLVTSELIRPKLSKLNPISGFKNLFSLRSVVEAVKNLLKISVLMYLIYACLIDMIEVAANYMYYDIQQACINMFNAIFNMMWKVGLAFTAVAFFDYLYQRWDYERQLKMSKEEVKEEYKQVEGDPKIKGRIREIQRKMSQQRMMSHVPQADVVIRNPSHYAVALRYKTGEDRAPVVLAKGQDELALRIVKIAEDNGVAVIENVPLARALYAQVDLDREIPPQLYGAVAEVLVYLYKLNKLKSKKN